jgi:xanthine phosphoribosyltransferase
MKISWEQFTQDIDNVIDRINESNIKYDTIVSISRGGLFPAGLIAKRLDISKIINISCESYDTDNNRGDVIFYNRFHFEDFVDSQGILIVDDILDTGNTMKAVINKLEGVITTAFIGIACPYFKPSIAVDIDTIRYVSSCIGKDWVKFPWEDK